MSQRPASVIVKEAMSCIQTRKRRMCMKNQLNQFLMQTIIYLLAHQGHSPVHSPPKQTCTSVFHLHHLRIPETTYASTPSRFDCLPRLNSPIDPANDGYERSRSSSPDIRQSSAMSLTMQDSAEDFEAMLDAVPEESKGPLRNMFDSMRERLEQYRVDELIRQTTKRRKRNRITECEYLMNDQLY